MVSRALAPPVNQAFYRANIISGLVDAVSDDKRRIERDRTATNRVMSASQERVSVDIMQF